MKVLSSYTVSKTLMDSNMESDINMPLYGTVEESTGGGQICDMEQVTLQPVGAGNGINRWKSLLLRMRKRSASELDTPTSSDSKPELFGQCLSSICDSDLRLPQPIMDILFALYNEGTTTEGVFRRAGNVRAMKEIKEQLNNGEEVDIKDKPIILLASLLKDFLRHIPGSLLMVELYEVWVKAMDTEDLPERCEALKKVLYSLPNHNILMLQHLLCVLQRISKHSSTNKMNAKNLAVCIGPTLLQLDTVEMADKVTSLTEYLIEHCCEIFGEEIEAIFEVADEEELGDSLDSVSLQQQDSAYDSPDPDTDTELGDHAGGHQAGAVKYVPHQSNPSKATVRRFSKHFSRRCSEPIILNTNEIKIHQALARSHDDFSVKNSDCDENYLKKQSSDDSFLVTGRNVRRTLQFPKSLELPVPVRDSSYSSSCSLESASSCVSEDSIFCPASTTSTSRVSRPAINHKSFNAICAEEVKKERKQGQRRTQSMRIDRKAKSRIGLKKGTIEKESWVLSYKIQKEPLYRTHSLSTAEVFELVDRKRPGCPPSYRQAVTSDRPMTVQDARNLSHHVLVNEPVNGNTDACCYLTGELKDDEITKSVFRQRTMSESESQRRETVSHRMSHPLFDVLSSAKESYV